MMANINELNKMLYMVTGLTAEEVADAVVNGAEDALTMKVSAHVRREHEKSDVFKNAIDEMLRDRHDSMPTKEGRRDRRCWLKVAFIAPYWKIATVMKLAELLHLKIEYYSCGTGGTVEWLR